jgi:hypothetical protein
MRRRDFIKVIAGSKGGGDTDNPRSQPNITAFLQALQQLGWTDGRNVKIDFRWPAPTRLANTRGNWSRLRPTLS